MIVKFKFIASNYHDYEIECKLNEQLSDRGISDEQIISVIDERDQIIVWYRTSDD